MKSSLNPGLQHQSEPLQRNRSSAGENAQSLQDNRSASPIQRRPNNTGLSDQMKDNLEAMSGYDMSDVKVHYNSDKPAQLQAHAYAQGNQIHLGPGQEKHLGHEAWHVVQQKQGRVRATRQLKGGVGVNDDVGLEREADLMDKRVNLMGAVPNELRTGNQKKTAKPISNPIQRSLIVREKGKKIDYSEKYNNGEELEELIETVYYLLKLHTGVPYYKSINTKLNDKSLEPKYKKELGEWIKDNPGLNDSTVTIKQYGRKKQDRDYDNYKTLAVALVGWVDAEPNRQLEKVIAERIYEGDGVYDRLLNMLIFKIGRKIKKFGENDPRFREIKTGKAQKIIEKDGKISTSIVKYGWYEKEQEEYATESGHKKLNPKFPEDRMKIFDYPDAYSMYQKVIFLHDLSEYFGQPVEKGLKTAGMGKILPDKKDSFVTTKFDSDGKRLFGLPMMTDSKKKTYFARGKGKTHGQRDEIAPSTRLAREYKLPVWPGQSMTIVRMLKFAQNFSATVSQKTALALAVFAFWRKDYNYTSKFAPHTLFETLDPASNFGVDYKLSKTINGRSDILDGHPLELFDPFFTSWKKTNLGAQIKKVETRIKDIRKISKEISIPDDIKNRFKIIVKRYYLCMRTVFDQEANRNDAVFLEKDMEEASFFLSKMEALLIEIEDKLGKAHFLKEKAPKNTKIFQQDIN